MRYFLVSLAVLSLSPITRAADWLTLPSTYSHDATGARVFHYAPIKPPTAPGVVNFRSSGYTHTRSSLNYGQSADNYHRVEQWGDPVRPYGEWRFPYRPYSTPYPNWGPPFAGFNLGFGFPGYGANVPGGYRGSGHRGHGPHHGHQPHEGDTTHEANKPDKGVKPKYRPNRERGFLGGGRWPSDRSRQSPPPASPFNPYPAGPGTPYPVAPYYDGYSPVYDH